MQKKRRAQGGGKKKRTAEQKAHIPNFPRVLPMGESAGEYRNPEWGGRGGESLVSTNTTKIWGESRGKGGVSTLHTIRKQGGDFSSAWQSLAGKRRRLK